jgi:hypothetical protein
MRKIFSVFRGSSSASSTTAEAEIVENGGEQETGARDLPVAVAIAEGGFQQASTPLQAIPATRADETSSRQAVATAASPISSGNRRYKDCVTKDEKIAWLQSDYGQQILAQRPVLLEYYQSGYIYRIIDNKHWKIRLEEWLTVEEDPGSAPTVDTSGPSEATVPGKAAAMAATSSSVSNSSSSGSSSWMTWLKGSSSSASANAVLESVNSEESEKSTAEKSAAGKAMAMKKGGTVTAPPIVPYGLNLPKTEQEKERDRDDYLVPAFKNPPLQDYFRAPLEHYRGSTFSIEDKLLLLTEGFVVVRQVVPLEVVAKANAAITEAIKQDNELIHYIGQKNIDRDQMSERMKRRREMDPFFLSGGLNHLDVLALYYHSPVYHMVEDILHNYSGKNEINPPFRAAVGGAQVAYRFSQPRPQSASSLPSMLNRDKDNQYDTRRQYIGGKSWHVDGLENGKYGSFSFLIGFALNDQMGEFSGNLCLHPGSHYTLLPYLKHYFNQSDVVQQGDDPELYHQRAHAVKQIPRPDLGEPVQVMVNAGDVVFALHKVGHLGGPNYSPNIRKMIYFRVSHRNHAELRAQSFDNVWVEFEGMQELVHM